MSIWIPLGIGIVWLAVMAGLAWRRDGRWQDVGAGGLLALFVVAFFWRTVAGDVFQPADGGDLVSFLFPTYRFAARTLTTGHLPLWNPTLYAGTPFIADIQAGFLYPPNLILFFSNPDFPYPWLQWLSMAHLWWAGLGVYVLVRVLGFSRPAALLGGTAFALSDPLLIHLGNLNLIAVLSWLGWVLAAFHLSLARRSLRWVAITAVLFSVANYAGHAQSSYYVGLALAVYMILNVIGDWRLANGSVGDWRGLRILPVSQSLLSFFMVAGLTFLLSAPLLLPAFELIGYTARAEFDYQDTVSYSLAPAPGIVGLLTPGFFGRGPALHWSLWDRVELPYAGIPTLLLAVAALLLPGDVRRRRGLLPWIGLGLFGFVVALGIYTPVHGWLTQILPGYAAFRAPARAIVLFTLAWSVLAAAGLDAVVRRGAQTTDEPGVDRTTYRTPDTRTYVSFLRWGGLALLLIALPLSYASLLFYQEDSVAFLRTSLAGLAVTLATLAWLGTWLLVALLVQGKLTSRWFAILVIGLLLIELSATGSYTDIAETNPAATFDHPQVVGFLHNQSRRNPLDEPDSDVELTATPQHSSLPFRIDTRTGIDHIWQPDTAALAGLQDVGGIVNPLALHHWEVLWHSLGGRDTRLYDMLNVRYVVVEDDTPLPDQFTLAFNAPGPLAVYENPDPLPRAWLVVDALIVADETAALAALTAPDFDPRYTVILTTDDPVATSFQPSTWPSAPSLRLSLSSYATNEMEVTVAAENPAYLVLSELWYPGWRAAVNGENVPVLRANYALRAVPVPAGESTVRIWFTPMAWRWGLGLFAAGLVVLVTVFLNPLLNFPPHLSQVEVL